MSSTITLYRNGDTIEFDAEYLVDSLSAEYHILEKYFYTSDDLYRLLCDICETSYHEPVEALLEKLKSRLG